MVARRPATIEAIEEALCVSSDVANGSAKILNDRHTSYDEHWEKEFEFDAHYWEKTCRPFGYLGNNGKGSNSS
jgi:hypothetical protein